MLQSLIPREIKSAISSELDLYPVAYLIDSRKDKCFVDIEAGDGSKDRVFFNGHPRSGDARYIVRIVADLRRSLATMGVEKTESRRARSLRNTSLGDKMIEAIEPQPDPSDPVIVAPFFPEKPCHISKNIELPLEPVPPPSAPQAPAAEKQKEKTMSAQITPVPKLVANNGNVNQAPAPAPKYAKLIQSEIVRITRLILSNASIDEASHIVTYHDGWSDKRIADVIAAVEGREALTEKHVIELRKKDFGLLPSEQERTRNKGSADDRIAALESDVRELRAKIARFEEQLGPL